MVLHGIEVIMHSYFLLVSCANIQSSLSVSNVFHARFLASIRADRLSPALDAVSTIEFAIFGLQQSPYRRHRVQTYHNVRIVSSNAIANRIIVKFGHTYWIVDVDSRIEDRRF